jgi:lipid-A-disaccharide synthase-like uncharacterized protein
MSPVWYLEILGGCCVFEKHMHCQHANIELLHTSWQVCGEILNWDVLGVPGQLVFQNFCSE